MASALAPLTAAPAWAAGEALQDGWNLPPPPLPAEVLEGTNLARTLKIRRSDGQPVSDAWLKGQLESLELEVDGKTTPLTREGGDFKLQWTAPASGTLHARLQAKVGGALQQGPVITITVLPNVRLKAGAGIDFAQVLSGCALDEHCKPVDLSGSQQLRGGQKLALSRPATQPGGLKGWPELRVHVRQGTGSPLYPLEHGAPAIAIAWAADKPLELCYAAPRCQPVPADTQEAVVLAPVGKGLVEADRAATVVLKAAVTANPMWFCYWPYLAGAIGLALFIVILVGFLKPHAFPKSAVLFVGAQESHLARDGGRPLYSVPGGRRGFYRSASCTFDGSGMTVRRGSGGVLVLHAHGNDIRIEARTDLEVKERSRWRAVPADEKILQRGAIHRVGKSFYFRID
ncbi:MAG: hypothetical protein HY902_04030 [Deltaproteobacteria bacterium]|nr:hypothetical protein [Deltaproteobacteria bacterium]